MYKLNITMSFSFISIGFVVLKLRRNPFRVIGASGSYPWFRLRSVSSSIFTLTEINKINYNFFTNKSENYKNNIPRTMFLQLYRVDYKQRLTFFKCQ